MDRLRNDAFLYLVDTPYEDERQNIYVALLEACPQSKAEAQAVILKAHYKHEREFRKYRRNNKQLDEHHDPAAPQQDDENCPVSEALDTLSDDDAELIRMHVLDGMSLRDIAAQLGIPRETLRRRYNHAKDELKRRVGQFDV